MRIGSLLIILFLSCLHPVFAQIEERTGGSKQEAETTDSVKVGMLVTSIRNIDFNSSSFYADIWLWFIYQNEKYINHGHGKIKEYPNVLEWPDAIDANHGGQPEYQNADVDDSTDKIQWKCVKISCPFRKKWDLTHYPFDKQDISLILESSDYEQSELILIPDDGKIDEEFLQSELEYQIIDTQFKSHTKQYKTAFGNPENKDISPTSSFSGVEFSFTLLRKNRWVTFMKLFIGILISFVLSLSVFYIKPTNLDARFGLCVGGLFSAIGSKYIVDSMIPMNYQNTLFDHIHNVTFVYIFLITIISIISLRFCESPRPSLHAFSRKIDAYGFWICLVTYLFIISAMVINASMGWGDQLIVFVYFGVFFLVGSSVISLILTLRKMKLE